MTSMARPTTSPRSAARLEPFSVPHFERYCYGLRLDDGDRFVVHDFQKSMAVQMPAIHMPGLATLFDFSWPWLANFGYYRSWNNQSAAADLDQHHWYDKSKDTRTS